MSDFSAGVTEISVVEQRDDAVPLVITDFAARLGGTGLRGTPGHLQGGT
jgi:hypothetical protein